MEIFDTVKLMYSYLFDLIEAVMEIFGYAYNEETKKIEKIEE